MSDRFHLRGLNGLRAIAAFAVVLSHTLRDGPDIGLPELGGGLLIARFGVTIFFALSGFLITSLLLIEKKKTNTVNIRAFYLRRIFRIFPLYYFYLFIAFAVIMIWEPAEMNNAAWFYVFFSANMPFILGMTMPILDHYWSLGVEEQFYMFWPWLMKKTKRIVQFLVIFIGIFMLLKLGAWAVHAKWAILWPYSILEIIRFDCMAIGALGAVLYFQKHQFFIKLVQHPVVELMAWTVVGCLMAGILPMFSVVSNEFVAVITVILIMNVSLNPRNIISLDYPIFNFLGKISYGIYVYHPLVIFFTIKLLPASLVEYPDLVKYIVLLSTVAIVTVLLAWCSYELLEKRFLKRKEKFSVVPSSSVRPEGELKYKPIPNQ